MDNFENSWHFITLDTKNVGDFNHNYICSCGEHSVLQLNSFGSDFPNLKCKRCSNTYYVDYERFREKNVTYWKSLNVSDECYQDEKGWHLLYYINTPSYNYSDAKVVKNKQYIYTISLNYNGSVDKKVLDMKLYKVHIYDNENQTIESYIKDRYATTLKNFINQNITYQLEWIDQNKLTPLQDADILKVYSFVLANPNVRDVRLFDWDFSGCEDLVKNFSNVDEGLEFVMHHRKEKSVKKAIYKSYTQGYGRYGVLYDYLICELFSDANFVVRLLDFEMELKKELFVRYEYRFLVDIFTFLKQFYTQKQLFNIFVTSFTTMENFELFRDAMQMLGNKEFVEDMGERFVKNGSSVEKFHDAVLEIYVPYTGVRKKRISDQEFEYLKSQQDVQGEFDGLIYKLPKNELELFKWGRLLRNCVGSYSDRIVSKRSLIYGVFASHRLIYAINIQNNRIVEMKGFSNKVVPREDALKIYKWFRQSNQRVELVA